MAAKVSPGVLAAIAIAAAVAVPRVAYAERVVSGTVVDASTGAPIAGAMVTVGNGEATTDDDGRFRISDVPFDRVDVLVLADGYGVYFGSARIGARLAIKLDPESDTHEVIRMSGHAPPTPPLHLDTTAIRTQPGAGNDVLRALQSMPGVARTPFGLGGLALRGSAPRDTKVYLDGIEVPLLYHFGGLASFLPTNVVDEVTLEPGGASVRYGRGLGGVAVVTSRTGRRDGWHAGGELSLIHAAALGEGPGPLGGSVLFGFRRSYFDAILAAASIDLILVPRYMDAQARWESGDGRWMAILFGSDDRLSLIPQGGSEGGFDTSNLKSFAYTSRFARLGVRYRAVRGASSFAIMPSIGVDDVDARANHQGIDKGMHLVDVPLWLRAEVSTPWARGTLSAGFDGGWQDHYYDLVNTPPPTPDDPNPHMVVPRKLSKWSDDLGLWVEESWTFDGDRYELRPGLRGDHFGLSGQWTLDPRLVAIAHLADDLTVTQTLGRYHEPPLVTDLDPFFPRPTPMLGSASIQVATSVKKIVGDDKEASATVYYQDLRQLPVDAITAATPTSANGSTESGGLLGISRELVDSQFGSYSYRQSVGSGRAYGLELILRKNLGRWTGWAAYTYARAFRTNPTRTDGEHPYVLDQPHSLTVVGSTTLGRRAKWRVGGRVRFTTGNPLTPVAGAYQNMKGDWVPVDGPILSDRLPDFFQLDVRLDRAWRRGWGTLDLYIDVQNVVNRANPEGVTYNDDFTHRSYTTGLPIFPSIGVEYTP